MSCASYFYIVECAFVSQCALILILSGMRFISRFAYQECITAKKDTLRDTILCAII